jgi:hypothetical protein
LAQTAVGIAANKGKVGTAALEEFYAAGYTKENVVDLVGCGIITVTNLFHNVTDVAIDFPVAVNCN